MRVYGEDRPDLPAQVVLIALPIGVGVGSYLLGWWLTEPTALLPSVALLSGVLLAVSGQLISLRARIADSVLLAANSRVKSIFREALSGIILAAVAALVAAILLGIIAVLPVQATGPKAAAAHTSYLSTVPGRVATALFAAVATFLVLMFVASARRLYLAYLEAFEGGRPLPKASNVQVRDSMTGMPDEQNEDTSDEALRALDIPSTSKNFGADK